MDSEFVLAEQEDSVRRSQLLCHLAREGHVMHKFGWGNSKSLRELPAQVPLFELLRAVFLGNGEFSCVNFSLLAPGRTAWTFASTLCGSGTSTTAPRA